MLQGGGNRGSHAHIDAISGTSGSSGFGSVNNEHTDSNTCSGCEYSSKSIQTQTSKRYVTVATLKQLLAALDHLPKRFDCRKARNTHCISFVLLTVYY